MIARPLGCWPSEPSILTPTLSRKRERGSRELARKFCLRRLLLDRLRLRACSDLDRPRLHRLGDLAHEFDMQHAVVEAGADHLDGIGELEAALEGPAADVSIGAKRSRGAVQRVSPRED